MKQIHIALFALLAGTAFSYSQAPVATSKHEPAVSVHQRLISGIVHAGTQRISGAKIVVSLASSGAESSMVKISDSEGRFSIEVPDGTWTLRVEASGYQFLDRELVIDVTWPDSPLDLDLNDPARTQAILEIPSAEPAPPPLPIVPSVTSAGQSANFGTSRQGIGNEVATDSVVVNGSQLSPQVMASPTSPAATLVNGIHGEVFYIHSDSDLAATPYSLSGTSGQKTDFSFNSFGQVVSGPFSIPHVIAPGPRNWFMLYFEAIANDNLQDTVSRVPTEAERNGDFSKSAINSGANSYRPMIFDPTTGSPFPGSIIPVQRIDSAASALLRYFPLPNQPGLINYRLSEAVSTAGGNVGFHLVHNLGSESASASPQGGSLFPSSLGVEIRLSGGKIHQLQRFPAMSGYTDARGLFLEARYNVNHGDFANELQTTFNQTNRPIVNGFANRTAVASEAGIAGTSAAPGDWGFPSLRFSNFSGVDDVLSSGHSDKWLMAADSVSWHHRVHAVQFGGGYRNIVSRFGGSTNPNGTFTFSGFATSQYVNGAVVPGTGFDLADFLLGMPQQALVQYGPTVGPANEELYDKEGDLYFQDLWRPSSVLSLELGVRYEYASPFAEGHNRMANLDAAPDFSAVAVVLPGGVGPYNGHFPTALIRDDKDHFLPRIGLAWRPFAAGVLRCGYAVHFDYSPYRSAARHLALQPPFSRNLTVTAVSSGRLVPGLVSLQSGLTQATVEQFENNYGIDRSYQVPYVQIWNLNLENQIDSTSLVTVGYVGTKGIHLDMMRAPNRGPGGTLLAGTIPFLWESAEASSIFHSGTIDLIRRMSKGLSYSLSYSFGHSIDNASSIGGGTEVVAQNDRNLQAERGLSSFDMRHQVKGSLLYELPFGTGKHRLDNGGLAAILLGDWNVSSTVLFHSGTPWTPRVLGDVTSVTQGTNGSLRGDYNGEPVKVSKPTTQRYFNTAAFSVPYGHFGTAGRNMIPGPSLFDVDVALSKNFQIKNGRGFEIRLVSVNLLNRPNFTSLDTVVNSPTFGTVQSVGPMRQFLLASRFRF